VTTPTVVRPVRAVRALVLVRHSRHLCGRAHVSPKGAVGSEAGRLAFCDAANTLLRRDDLWRGHSQLAASGFSYASASRAIGWLNRTLKNFGFTEARRSISMIRRSTSSITK